MLVAVHQFLLSSRRSAYCRWALSLGKVTLVGLLSWLHVTSPSAAYVSICHLAFSWLWEVELYTQPCFRRMTWTGQTADKAKSLSKSELGENTPPHPSKSASVSAEQPVPKSKCCHELSCLEMLSPAWSGCEICPPRRREEDGLLPAAEGREGHCLSCQVEEHVQLLMWLSVNDWNWTCCNSILLQVKGFHISHLESKWVVLPLLPDRSYLLLLESQGDAGL